MGEAAAAEPGGSPGPAPPGSPGSAPVQSSAPEQPQPPITLTNLTDFIQ